MAPSTMFNIFVPTLSLFLAAPTSSTVLRGMQHSSLPVSADLLHELDHALEAAGGRRVVEARAQEFEEAMLPTFRTLPRLPGDRVDPGAARYLLYRAFLARRNWAVLGFESGGDAWNSSSPASVFGQTPLGDGIGAAFEERLAKGGLTLRECAVLAATLEGLVRSETLLRLRGAYVVAGLENPEAREVREHEAERVLQVFLAVFLLRLPPSELETGSYAHWLRTMEESSAYWPPTLSWLHTLREELTGPMKPEDTLSFQVMSQLAEEIDFRYGSLADDECSGFRSDIMQYQRGSTGRVPLTSFYGAALYNGSWQFAESRAYLRDLGALDETDPLRPSVIIPNYIHAPSNCVGTSAFYTVCCTNHCEDLLAKLEQQIASPYASPKQIVELVERLPSSTVRAPRVLPPLLVERLEGIAAEHGGHVPLHGRLFAQWMHNAYPNDCEFPHATGSTRPLALQDWKDATGLSPVASKTDMEEFIAASKGADAGAVPADEEHTEAVHPWQPEEELRFHAAPPAPIAGRSRMWLRAPVLLASAGSVALALWRAAAGARDHTMLPLRKCKEHLI